MAILVNLKAHFSGHNQKMFRLLFLDSAYFSDPKQLFGNKRIFFFLGWFLNLHFELNAW